MQKFIITANSPTPEQQDLITNFVKAQRWAYWHWFDSIWLLASVPEDWTAKGILAELELNSSLEYSNLIIMKVSDPISYWGKSPARFMGLDEGKLVSPRSWFHGQVDAILDSVTTAVQMIEVASISSLTV